MSIKWTTLIVSATPVAKLWKITKDPSKWNYEHVLSFLVGHVTNRNTIIFRSFGILNILQEFSVKNINHENLSFVIFFTPHSSHLSLLRTAFCRHLQTPLNSLCSKFKSMQQHKKLRVCVKICEVGPLVPQHGVCSSCGLARRQVAANFGKYTVSESRKE